MWCFPDFNCNFLTQFHGICWMCLQSLCTDSWIHSKCRNKKLLSYSFSSTVHIPNHNCGSRSSGSPLFKKIASIWPHSLIQSSCLNVISPPSFHHISTLVMPGFNPELQLHDKWMSVSIPLSLSSFTTVVWIVGAVVLWKFKHNNYTDMWPRLISNMLSVPWAWLKNGNVEYVNSCGCSCSIHHVFQTNNSAICSLILVDDSEIYSC